MSKSPLNPIYTYHFQHCVYILGGGRMGGGEKSSSRKCLAGDEKDSTLEKEHCNIYVYTESWEGSPNKQPFSSLLRSQSGTWKLCQWQCKQPGRKMFIKFATATAAAKGRKIAPGACICLACNDPSSLQGKLLPSFNRSPCMATIS